MQQSVAIEDLTSVEWRDTNWIDRVGGFQNQQMVLEYFALSPFWDRQSNNQILSMQTQYNDLQHSYEATVEALRKMTGIEFAVIHDHPPVWVIQKRYRRGPAPDDVNPIATYYIMGANVYQSPTIYSVIANRLLTSLFHVNSAFKETQAVMDFNPSKGYSWKTKKEKSDKNQPNALRAQENQTFRICINRAIDTSAIRVDQAKHDIEHPDTSSSTPTLLGKSQSSDSLSSLSQQDSSNKRPRKKNVDESNGLSAIKKKKKSTPSTVKQI
ncbi:unnamed protein product [Cunninghamella blakesleeana]